MNEQCTGCQLQKYCSGADELMERIAKLQELQRAGVCTLKGW